jgi:hypothetical protein
MLTHITKAPCIPDGEGVMEFLRKKKENVLINTTAASPPQKNNARNHNEKFNIPTAMFTG